MKILFAGLGSIGQRHLQNIQHLIQKGELKKDTEIFALIKDSDTNKFIKDGNCSFVEDIGSHYGIKTIKSIEEAKGIKPDVVFVVNPSSLHVETAIEFAKTRSHLFIEKPLGNDLEKFPELEKAVEENNLVTQVGFQTRFNPLVKEIKKIVEENKEKVIAASFEWNTYMPFHHKYEDYREGYAARKDLGGGVVLGLIHEIDLVYYLFGFPQNYLVSGGKLSNLEMTAEDMVFSILEYNKNGKTIPVLLNLSYAQTKEVRKFKIQFFDKTLFVDLMENEYKLYDLEGNLEAEKKFDVPRNDLFINEISYFFGCIEKRNKSFVDIHEAKKSLEIALKIKEMVKS